MIIDLPSRLSTLLWVLEAQVPREAGVLELPDRSRVPRGTARSDISATKFCVLH